MQKQSFLAATKNTKIVESNIASKSLEIERLLGVIASLGAREREEAANIARLHTRVFTLETSIQQLRLTASMSHSEDTRVSQLEMELRSAVEKRATLRQEYETLVSQGVAKRNEARAHKGRRLRGRDPWIPRASGDSEGGDSDSAGHRDACTLGHGCPRFCSTGSGVAS